MPETIEFLMQCGMHVWMLTGDKQDTAVNIAMASRLIQEDMNLILLNALSPEKIYELLVTYLSDVRKLGSSRETALIVDGATLALVLKDYPALFLELCELCRSVVCCRVGPLQKSLVVKLVMSKLHRICLAIGDGANDVSMIQTANIGVGIAGKEGAQAVRASDYSFVQFKSLARLLAVHGRYSYLRMSTLICYSFYKNLALIMIQFWFAIWNGWSGQTLVHQLVMSLFNVLYTSGLPFLSGVFEKDVHAEILIAHPQLYRTCKEGSFFSAKVFLGYMASALWQSLVIFFGVMLSFSDGDVFSDGQIAGFSTMSFITSTIAITVVLLKMVLITRTWTIINVVGVLASYTAYFCTLLLISYGNVFYYDVPAYMFSSGYFYFVAVLLIVASLFPDYVVK